MKHLKHLWRVIVKGLALLFIFVGGGVLAMVIMPVSELFLGKSVDRTQYFIHHIFRFYLRVLQICGMIKLDIYGLENLQMGGGRIVIANHPSLLDVVILMSIIPKPQCIVKHQLWKHSFLGSLMRSANYIPNDLPPEQLMERCKEAMDRGQILILFPEGTRTKPNTALHFQRGFANIAMFASAQIQPVVIDCQPPVLFKGEPWWYVTQQVPHFRVTIDKCLESKDYATQNDEVRSLSVRKLVNEIKRYYAEKLR